MTKITYRRKREFAAYVLINGVQTPLIVTKDRRSHYHILFCTKDREIPFYMRGPFRSKEGAEDEIMGLLTAPIYIDAAKRPGLNIFAYSGNSSCFFPGAYSWEGAASWGYVEKVSDAICTLEDVAA